MRIALRLTRSYGIPMEERIEPTTQSSGFDPSFRLRQSWWMASSKRLFVCPSDGLHSSPESVLVEESDVQDVVVDVEYPGNLGSFSESLLYGSCVAVYLPEQSTSNHGQDRGGYGFADIDRFVITLGSLLQGVQEPVNLTRRKASILRVEGRPPSTHR